MDTPPADIHGMTTLFNTLTGGLFSRLRVVRVGDQYARLR